MNCKKFPIVAVLLLVAGCTEMENLGVMRQQNFEKSSGKKWPLTVPVGAVRCTRPWLGKPVLLFLNGSYTYRLNKGGENSNTCQYTESSPCPIDLITKPDPKNPRAKMDISALRDRVSGLCPPKTLPAAIFNQ